MVTIDLVIEADENISSETPVAVPDRKFSKAEVRLLCNSNIWLWRRNGQTWPKIKNTTEFEKQWEFFRFRQGEKTV